VRPGVLLRSDNLQGLTPHDVSVLLDELDVRTVVDLRSASEVASEGPGPLVGRVEIRHRDLYPAKGTMTDVIVDRSDPRDWYLRYLQQRPDSIVGALTDIAESPGATLVHCAAGKDRTGVVVALALAVAGVEREAIVADYLLTGERIAAIMRRLRASETYRAELEPYSDDSRRPQRELLERVFDDLEARYGGPVAWLETHGFDPSGLRNRLRT